MPVKTAEFIISNTQVERCPVPDKPEYAFIGRSNVGKSSLINRYTGRNNLAKTSGRPGKTQLINHFLIDKAWYLTDLPGYGYAKVSKTARQKFQKIIEDYILKRQNLVNLFVLIDSRHEPQQIDLEFMEWLGECGVPFSMVFTKTDKLKTATKVKNSIEAYTQKMLERWEEMPVYFVTSAESGAGIPELEEYITELNRKVSES
jgi:GTP-binding protein